jgi:lipopolysaccharide export system permease protein
VAGEPLGDGGVSRTIFRYIVRTYLGHLATVSSTGLVIFLVADFIDRAHVYAGASWVRDVLELYGYKALTMVQQLGPAMLLVSAGTTVSVLRRRGELTALKSLSFGPASLYLPIGLCVAVAALALVAFEETIVVKAGRRVDEITTSRFNRWGDWQFYFTPKQWFRRGERIFHLRRGNPEAGYQDVTVLYVTPEFHLARRLDASRMTHVEGPRWSLTDVVDRRFTAEGETLVESASQALYDFDVDKNGFRVRQGRPEQMRLRELRQEISIRRQVGLPTSQFRLATHNRFAYALAALPGALIAIGLALRPGRKGHLAAAIVEGFGVALGLWGGIVIFRALAIGERLPAPVAAWASPLVLAVIAALLWLRREGRLGTSGI